MDFKSHLSTYLNENEINKLYSSLEGNSFSAVLLNLNKMNDEEFVSLFPEVTKHPIIPHAYIFDKEKYPLGKTIYHELGAFYIQEPSAMLVSYLLSPKENDIVLDMCAAPGGKTIQASLLMNNTGLLISNDISFPRLKALKENVERMGCGNIIITNNDFTTIYTDYIDTFDKIILDAPCSGSGMFRKDSRMVEDWSINKVYKNQEVQKQLILTAYQMLKPGGTLAYSTCSFSYEEDEEVIKYLLEKTDCFLENISDSIYYFKSKDNLGIHMFPYLFTGEGHYICLIKKPGELKSSTTISYKKNRLGDDLYLSLEGIKTKRLNILRNGVKLGEQIKDEIKYDYHYAHFVNDFDNIININKDELVKYMKGESLNKATKKGHYLIRYNNMRLYQF